jgi:hypothetical protein
MMTANPIELEQQLALRGSNAYPSMFLTDADEASDTRAPNCDISFWSEGRTSSGAFNVVEIRSHTGARWISCSSPNYFSVALEPLFNLGSVVDVIRTGSLLPIGSPRFESLLIQAAAARGVPADIEAWAATLAADISNLTD